MSMRWVVHSVGAASQVTHLLKPAYWAPAANDENEAHEALAGAVKSRAWTSHRFFDVWVDDLPMNELLDTLDLCGGMVFTLNPEHLYHQRRDPKFLRAYGKADIITVDSQYIFRGLRWLNKPVRETVCGSDLVPAYLKRHKDNTDVRVFLLGGVAGSADGARKRINALAGRNMVVDALSPSTNFVNNSDEIASTLDKIRSSKANVLFVGLGAPKQELWLAQHRAALPEVRILVGVGATIDYVAGRVKRAPLLWRRCSLEWAYRVLTQPRRYFFRYVRNSEFIWRMAWAWLTGRQTGGAKGN
jgi:N-acetylglucosaminyldiphosphoundecaprenol N-acetyl-beta-D-mannosaminyltransferase